MGLRGPKAVAPIRGDCAARHANDLVGQGADTNTKAVWGALVAQRPTTAPVRYLVAIGPGGVAWASAPPHGDRGLRAALGHALPTSPGPAAAGSASH